MGKSKLKVLIELMSAAIKIARNPASVERIEGATEAIQISDVQAFTELREVLQYVRQDIDSTSTYRDDIVISDEVNRFVTGLFENHQEPPAGSTLVKFEKIDSILERAEGLIAPYMGNSALNDPTARDITLTQLRNNRDHITVPVSQLAYVIAELSKLKPSN
ncbi:hypothetical protein S1R3X_000098 [Vibrio phage vB_ValS_VA-RY-4]|nr:hypothetical protein ValSw41_20 [Vibrio phage ValSw4_1]UFD98306.1 hypothetical protein S1R3X_000098 [Vibrio phage vB_ValS_VA-RY-4]